jgi:hypothetical protein
MTEDEVRALLAGCDGQGGLEMWIARQPWQVTQDGGWAVAGVLRGWRYTLALVPERVRVSANPGGGRRPAEWTVPARPRP